jgi:phosphoribosylformylglycinamidine synthase
MSAALHARQRLPEGRDVFGLMPHPERASEKILGSEDGRLIFESILHSAVAA